ncbi:MAG: hypothetical protein IPG07_02270 [Crocinitomicaceae bacterium]|nr:hypothetical protein [Crocinitomicaceae bacterium]
MTIFEKKLDDMKFYKALLLTSIVCGGSAFNASAQDFIYEWGHKIGGINNETGKCLTTDPDGNVLAAVNFHLRLMQTRELV